MTKIRKLYSYKGDFIGLDNYKCLSFLYDKKGEIKKPSENSVLFTGFVLTMFLNGYLTLLTPVAYPLVISSTPKILGVTLSNAKNFIL